MLGTNTDRRTRDRHAALSLAATVLISASLIDNREKWGTVLAPIR
jgi:hypothetical protein